MDSKNNQTNESTRHLLAPEQPATVPDNKASNDSELSKHLQPVEDTNEHLTLQQQVATKPKTGSSQVAPMSSQPSGNNKTDTGKAETKKKEAENKNDDDEYSADEQHEPEENGKEKKQDSPEEKQFKEWQNKDPKAKLEELNKIMKGINDKEQNFLKIAIRPGALDSKNENNGAKPDAKPDEEKKGGMNEQPVNKDEDSDEKDTDAKSGFFSRLCSAKKKEDQTKDNTIKEFNFDKLKNERKNKKLNKQKERKYVIKDDVKKDDVKKDDANKDGVNEDDVNILLQIQEALAKNGMLSKLSKKEQIEDHLKKLIFTDELDNLNARLIDGFKERLNKQKKSDNNGRDDLTLCKICEMEGSQKLKKYGFYTFYNDNEQINVCWECIWMDYFRGPKVIQKKPIKKLFKSLQTVKLCGHELQHNKDTEEPWVCASELIDPRFVGDDKLIPSEWAQCQSFCFNDTQIQKDDKNWQAAQLKNVKCFQSRECDFKLCLPCLIKWQNFEGFKIKPEDIKFGQGKNSSVEEDNLSPEKNKSSLQKDKLSPEKDKSSPEKDKSSPEKDKLSPEKDKSSPEKDTNKKDGKLQKITGTMSQARDQVIKKGKQLKRGISIYKNKEAKTQADNSTEKKIDISSLTQLDLDKLFKCLVELNWSIEVEEKEQRQIESNKDQKIVHKKNYYKQYEGKKKTQLLKDSKTRFKDIQNDYVFKKINKNCFMNQFKVNEYKLRPEDFKQGLVHPIFKPTDPIVQLRCRYKAIQVYEYKSDYWIIARTSDEILSEDNNCIYTESLIIFNRKNDFKQPKCNMLLATIDAACLPLRQEITPENEKEQEEDNDEEPDYQTGLPSIMIQGCYVYYFKRIYTDEVGKKTSAEKSEAQKSASKTGLKSELVLHKFSLLEYEETPVTYVKQASKPKKDDEPQDPKNEKQPATDDQKQLCKAKISERYAFKRVFFNRNFGLQFKVYTDYPNQKKHIFECLDEAKEQVESQAYRGYSSIIVDMNQQQRVYHKGTKKDIQNQMDIAFKAGNLLKQMEFTEEECDLNQQNYFKQQFFTVQELSIIKYDADKQQLNKETNLEQKKKKSNNTKIVEIYKMNNFDEFFLQLDLGQKVKKSDMVGPLLKIMFMTQKKDNENIEVDAKQFYTQHMYHPNQHMQEIVDYKFQEDDGKKVVLKPADNKDKPDELYTRVVFIMETIKDLNVDKIDEEIPQQYRIQCVSPLNILVQPTLTEKHKELNLYKIPRHSKYEFYNQFDETFRIVAMKVEYALFSEQNGAMSYTQFMLVGPDKQKVMGYPFFESTQGDEKSIAKFRKEPFLDNKDLANDILVQGDYVSQDISLSMKYIFEYQQKNTNCDPLFQMKERFSDENMKNGFGINVEGIQMGDSFHFFEGKHDNSIIRFSFHKDVRDISVFNLNLKSEFLTLHKGDEAIRKYINNETTGEPYTRIILNSLLNDQPSLGSKSKNFTISKKFKNIVFTQDKVLTVRDDEDNTYCHISQENSQMVAIENKSNGSIVNYVIEDQENHYEVAQNTKIQFLHHFSHFNKEKTTQINFFVLNVNNHIIFVREKTLKNQTPGENIQKHLFHETDKEGKIKLVQDKQPAQFQLRKEDELEIHCLREIMPDNKMIMEDFINFDQMIEKTKEPKEKAIQLKFESVTDNSKSKTVQPIIYNYGDQTLMLLIDLERKPTKDSSGIEYYGAVLNINSNFEFERSIDFETDYYLQRSSEPEKIKRESDSNTNTSDLQDLSTKFTIVKHKKENLGEPQIIEIFEVEAIEKQEQRNLLSIQTKEKECVLQYLSKQMVLMSPQENKTRPQQKMELLPIIDKNQEIESILIVLISDIQNNQKDEKGNSQDSERLIKLFPLSRAQNKKIIKYKTEGDFGMKFGIQKFFNDKNIRSKDNFYWVVKTQFEKQFLINSGHHFNNQKRRILLEDTCQMLLDQVEFKLKDYLFPPFDSNKPNYDTLSYFKRYEVLQSHSIADLYADDPFVILDALEHQANQDIACKMINKTIFEELYGNESEGCLDFLKKIGIFKGNSVRLIASDIYQKNLISRAFDKNAKKTIWLVMTHVLNCDERSQYQPEIMKALDDLLSIDLISLQCFKFFELTEGEEDDFNTADECKFETVLKSDLFQAFSQEQEIVLELSLDDSINLHDKIAHRLNSKIDDTKEPFNIWSFINAIFVTSYQLIKTKLQKKDEKEENQMQTTEEDKQLYEVETSFIDFKYYELAMKLKNNQNLEFKFNDFELSNLIDKMMESENSFYHSVSVVRMIDQQFKQSQNTFSILFFIYFVGFYAPLVVSIFHSRWKMKLAMLVICLLTVIMFYAIEVMQIWISKENYLKKGKWLLMDQAQFYVFMLYFIRFCILGEDVSSELKLGPIEIDHKELSVLTIHIQNFLLILGFFKIQFFLQQTKHFGVLTQMVSQTLSQSLNFMQYYMIWVVFFTLLFWNLRIEIADRDQEYPNIWEFMVYFLKTYRDSLGDLTSAGYTKWTEDLNTDIFTQNLQKKTIMSAIWAVYIVNQFVVTLILLNILLAVMGQAYEEQVSKLEVIQTKNRAILNSEHFIYMKMFEKLKLFEAKSFDILVFQNEKQTGEHGEEQFVGVVQTLKNFITKEGNLHMQKIRSETESVNEELERVYSDLKAVKDTLKDVQNKRSKRLRKKEKEEKVKDQVNNVDTQSRQLTMSQN